MQNRFTLLLTSLFLLVSASLFSTQYITAGPEIYHITRLRGKGTVQRGTMAAIRLNYDRIQAYRLYWGVDFFAAEGRLRGHNSKNLTICSKLKDRIVEGRIGYTLQQPLPTHPFFTPFTGYGYFHESNQFHDPSPIPITFVDTFNYVLAGFLAGANFTPLLSMGLNFKVQFMLNGKSRVKNDPIYDTVTLHFRNEINARVEVPVVYAFAKCLSAMVVPFYEFRHFGGQEDFPFDFIDTKFHLIGAKIALSYAF